MKVTMTMTYEGERAARWVGGRADGWAGRVEELDYDKE
jgi:hypothetical protein